MGLGVRRSVAITFIGLLGLIALCVGWVSYRMAMDQHGRLTALRYSALWASPPRTTVRATADDCALIGLVSNRHYGAHDMPLFTGGDDRPRRHDAYYRPSALRFWFPEITSNDARYLADQAWRPLRKFDIACDLRSAGLRRHLADEAFSDPPPCPENAFFGRFVSQRGRDYPRLKVCEDRPKDSGTPHIVFYQPVYTRDRRTAFLNTHVWYGNLGAEGYVCIARKQKSGWGGLACRGTWIS